MARLSFNHVRIAALACVVPEHVQYVNQDPDHPRAAYHRSFIKKIGISKRHIAVTGQTCTDTGFAAAQQALKKAGITAEELDAVFTDIRPDAVKIGMVSEAELIRVIARKLKEYRASHIVLDPVMVATSGAKLISDDAISSLTEYLLPLAELITPNIPEAEQLSGRAITSEEDMITAAREISSRYGCCTLLKGGHSLNDANDLLCRDGEILWFRGKRIHNPNTHGTGCTLSSAIAANLAKGFPLDDSVGRAKEYISGALGAMLDLGKGSGPMNHAFSLNGKYAEEASGASSPLH